MLPYNCSRPKFNPVDQRAHMRFVQHSSLVFISVMVIRLRGNVGETYTSLRVFTCSVSWGQLGGNLFGAMLIGALPADICRLRVKSHVARKQAAMYIVS